MTDRAPLRRWFTEGAVIVGSILLAFSIDAWWAESQEAAEMHSVAESLTSELRANIAAAEDVVRAHRVREDRLIRLTTSAPEAILSLPADSLRAAFRVFTDASTFDPAMGTLDALIASGGLYRLGDARLRGALTGYRQSVDDTRDELTYAQDVSLDIVRILAARGGPFTPGETTVVRVWVEPEADVLIDLLADESFMGLVRLNVGLGAFYAAEVEGTIAAAESALALLEL